MVMAKLGLVTVLYKSDDVLEGFFKSLSNQSYTDYHLYMIDNSPSEKTDELIKALLEKYPVSAYTHVKNTENVGVAKGNNQGIKSALKNNSEYILLLNNDICFDDSLVLKSLVEAGGNYKNCIIAPKIYYYNSDEIWYGGGKFLYRRGSVRHFIHNELEAVGLNFSEVSYAPTCFVLVPSIIFEKVGFMDESYFVYADDADFMMRVIQKEFKVLYVNTISIYHKVSISTGGMFSNFSLYYDTRNRVYLVRKLFKTKYKCTAFPYIFAQMTYHSLRQKRKGCFKIFLKAYKEGFKMKLPVI